MDITLDKRKMIRFLVFSALVLIVIHIIILIIYYNVGDPDKFDFIRMFDLDMERNVPTLFSSLILAMSAFCFYLLANNVSEIAQKKRPYWLGLSAVFIFLSFDESAKIHENLGDYTEQFVEASGYLHYPWVISYSILVLILGALYIKFFWKMERKIFLSFMLSAFMFLSGAIGFELLGAKESSLNGTESLLYSVFYTIEESLEMFGVIYLLWILLTLLEKKKIEVK
ncbi:MAG: hypothetical protein COA92_03995 [Sulfurovum sp.]|nr:MAG: hypothetical protein COA92_03995 [Sulfurovum sp.]